ncbi:MAG: hypothetical protein ACLUI3_14095 [Christensenellales bacterium]
MAKLEAYDKALDYSTPGIFPRRSASKMPKRCMRLLVSQTTAERGVQALAGARRRASAWEQTALERISKRKLLCGDGL